MHRKPSSSSLAIPRLVYIGNPLQSDRPSNNRSDGFALASIRDDDATHSSNVTLTS